jgi:NAD(P)H-dependent FMN reductase
VVISSPEYAHGIPGVLKNALDWDVSSGKLAGKPVALITASPSYLGAAKAQAALIQVLSAMSACIVDQASIDLPAVYKKFDEEGNLIDPEIIRLLQERMERFAAAIKAKSARDAV